MNFKICTHSYVFFFFFSSFFLPCYFLREGSQLRAVAKTFLNVVVTDVHAVGAVPHSEWRL